MEESGDGDYIPTATEHWTESDDLISTPAQNHNSVVYNSFTGTYPVCLSEPFDCLLSNQLRSIS